MYRNFPDVAMASGYTNIADFYTAAGASGPADITQSGTSESTPQWAGFTALANEAAQAVGVQTVGFAKSGAVRRDCGQGARTPRRAGQGSIGCVGQTE